MIKYHVTLSFWLEPCRVHMEPGNPGKVVDFEQTFSGP